MTDIRRSDAQLDAEAQAPLEERDLDVAIELHRALFRADIFIPRLHVRSGNGSSTAIGKDVEHVAPEPVGSPVAQSIGWTGMAFNQHFARFLDEEYGQAFPWSKALQSLRHMCRTMHHPKHTDRPEWRGSLCHSLVGMVVRLDYSLDMARLKLGLPEEGKSRRTLDNALLAIERRLEDAYWREQQGKPVERTAAEWMADEHVHVGLPGLHAVDCAQCIKRRAA